MIKFIFLFLLILAGSAVNLYCELGFLGYILINAVVCIIGFYVLDPEAREVTTEYLIKKLNKIKKIINKG